MEKGKDYFIPCAEQEYPEVKQMLEGLGFSEWFKARWSQNCTGITINGADEYFPYRSKEAEDTVITLPELRELAEK